MVLYQLTPIWIWLLLQLHCCMNPTSMTAQSSKAFWLWAVRTNFFHFIWALGPLILKPHRSNSFHTILLHGLIPYLQCKTKNKEISKNHFSKVKERTINYTQVKFEYNISTMKNSLLVIKSYL